MENKFGCLPNFLYIYIRKQKINNMLTLIIIIAIAAVATFILMKKGKIADANNNNIPDAIEKPIEVVKEKVAEVKEEVKEVAAKVKNAAPKKKPAKKNK